MSEAKKVTVKFHKALREAVRTGCLEIRRQRLSVRNASREKTEQRCDLVSCHFGSIDQPSEIGHPGGICRIFVAEVHKCIRCVAQQAEVVDDAKRQALLVPGKGMGGHDVLFYTENNRIILFLGESTSNRNLPAKEPRVCP